MLASKVLKANYFNFYNIASASKPRVAYLEDVTKHRHKLALYDLEPRTENAWIAPNATLGNIY
jgi:hypothetical protein